MAKGRSKKGAYEPPHIVEPQPVEPNCPRCKQTQFSSVQKTAGRRKGVFVFCSNCGCVIGWAPLAK